MNLQPQTHLPGSRPGTVLVPQGALVRGSAFLIDSFLASLVAAVILGGQAPLVKIVLVTLAVEFVYFALSEGVLGTTLGKRLFGLRVVRADDGRPCGPFAAVVRTLLRLVDNILFSVPGIAAIVSSPRRQRLGDRAAKTLVVIEVPEHLLTAIAGLAGAGPFDPEATAGRLNGPARRQPGTAHRRPDATSEPSAVSGRTASAGAEALRVSVLEDVVPCPFCGEQMSEDEIVCRHCDNYVNQASAHGETDDLAPVPELYSEDRNYRFDALWRLVFAGDEQSLGAVLEAVPDWPHADRLLAVHVFSEVADPRPVAFVDFMTHDPEPAVRALALEVRERLGTT